MAEIDYMAPVKVEIEVPAYIYYHLRSVGGQQGVASDLENSIRDGWGENSFEFWYAQGFEEGMMIPTGS